MTSASAPSPQAQISQLGVWTLLAWHGILGIALFLAGLLLFFNLVQVTSYTIQVGIALVSLILGVIQLFYWRGLRAYQWQSRIMSLVVNFLGFLAVLSIGFRQLTCQGRFCTADPNIFDPERFAMWIPYVPIIFIFGLMLYIMWQTSMANLYGETPRQREALTAYLYLSPYILTATIFTFGLLIYALGLSFTEFSNDQLYGNAAPLWVGLENYEFALSNTEFLISLSNVLWYSIIVVVFQTIISLSLAVMMNGNFVGKRFFRTLFYAPSVTSSVVISLIFLWLFNGRGIINYIVYDILGLEVFFSGIGLRAPNTNWLNTPTRLGDLSYLKPFFDGSWQTWLFIPLIIVGIVTILRVFCWQRSKLINSQATLYSGGIALLTAIILGALSGAYPSTVNVAGSMAIKVFLIALGAGLLAGLGISRLKTESDIDKATRSVVVGVSAATILLAILIALLTTMSGAETISDEAPYIPIYTVLTLFILATTLFAVLGQRSSQPEPSLASEIAIPVKVKIATHDDPQTPFERLTFFVKPSLWIGLVILCIVMIIIAGSTVGLEQAHQMDDEAFVPLLVRGPSVALMIIMLLNIFTTSPTFMIMFLAALQDIPISLYEAAQIDGANRWQQFLNVTLPTLRPVMLLIVVLGTIGTLQIFDQVHVMTAGGPVNTTLTPVYLIFTKAIGDQRPVAMGAAAAMAFLLGILIFVFTFFQRRYIESGTEQY